MRMRKGGTDQGDTLLWLQLCWGLSGHAGSSRLCTHSDPWATASLESQVSLKNIDSLPWGSPEAEILCGLPVVHWCTGGTNLLLRVGDDEPFRDFRVSEWMAFLLELQSLCEDTVPWFWSGDAWSNAWFLCQGPFLSDELVGLTCPVGTECQNLVHPSLWDQPLPLVREWTQISPLLGCFLQILTSGRDHFVLIGVSAYEDSSVWVWGLFCFVLEVAAKESCDFTCLQMVDSSCPADWASSEACQAAVGAVLLYLRVQRGTTGVVCYE